MLILTRRQGEQIVIGDEIVIEVKSIVDNRVQIGIDAPKDVSVDREEVRRAKQCKTT
jgi:carbon storage regulator